MPFNSWSQNKARHSQNADTWQIASWQNTDFAFLGIFDHFLIDDEHTQSWDELDETWDRDVLMEDLLQRLIPAGSRLIGDFIPVLGPSRSSLQNFFGLSDSAEAWSNYLQQFSFRLLQGPRASGHITVDFGMQPSSWFKLGGRLGRDPDQEPDLFLLDAQNSTWIETTSKLAQNFAQQSPAQHLIKEAKVWAELLRQCRMSIIALDGHLYLGMRLERVSFFRSILEDFAREKKWKIAQGHYLL